MRVNSITIVTNDTTRTEETVFIDADADESAVPSALTEALAMAWRQACRFQQSVPQSE